MACCSSNKGAFRRAGSIGFTRRAGAGRLVHPSMHQLLARFPAAVPALLDTPKGQQQRQQGPQQGGDAASGEPAGEAAAAAAAGSVPIVALVFGREESGLLESELSLCSHACAIPTGRSQPSLNLSHAAAVVLAQLFDAKQQRLLLELQGRRGAGPGQPPLHEDGSQAAAGPHAPGSAAAAAVVNSGLFDDGERAAGQPAALYTWPW
jgi:hypothetical protein